MRQTDDIEIHFFGLPAINADLLRFVLDVLQIKEAATARQQHELCVCVVSDRYTRKYLYLYLFVPGLMCENFRSLSGFFFGPI